MFTAKHEIKRQLAECIMQDIDTLLEDIKVIHSVAYSCATHGEIIALGNLLLSEFYSVLAMCEKEFYLNAIVDSEKALRMINEKAVKI